jgi:two-component system sensor histidine kinase UhpB
MKKGILILICFCCIGGLCDGQNKKIDSLLHLLKTTKEDTSKVNTFNALAKQFSDNNPDTAVYFANEALALATKVKYKIGIADAHYNIGLRFMHLEKVKEALENFNDALKLYDELLTSMTTADKSKILTRKSKTYNNIGRLNEFQGNWPEGLKNYAAALTISQEIGDKFGIARSHTNSGLIYLYQGNYAEALKKIFTSLKLTEESGNKREIANNLTNIGIAYKDQSNFTEALKYYFEALKIHAEVGNNWGKATTLEKIGSVYDDQHNYTEALKNYSAALKLNEELGDKSQKASILNNIGNVYGEQGNFNEALKNHLASLKIAEEIGQKNYMAYFSGNIGQDYKDLKKHKEAYRYTNKALALAKAIGSFKIIKSNYKRLSELDSIQSNFKQSLENYKMYIIYRDSITNKETTKKAMQIEMQYEFDKKESLAEAAQEKKDVIALKELQGQKLLKYFLFGGIGLLLVLFFFVYRTYRARQLLRLNDIRNKIAGDLHDDIGSTLNSISIYSEVARKNDENRDEALVMIGDAARKVIDAMSDIVWSINSENDSFEKIIFRMKSLAYNLFNVKKIEFTFDADETLNAKKLSLEERRNFYLIFKEAVNNLVKYSGARCVAITLDSEKDRIRLHIQDDGIGFDISGEKTGNGLKNMKRRADEMGALFIIDSHVGGGTQIELILKA